MAKTKLEECQACGQPTAEYMKNEGHHKCTNPECRAIWWDIVDKPSGVNGYKCYNCGKKTLQTVGQIGNVNVRRCKTCCKTLLEPIH